MMMMLLLKFLMMLLLLMLLCEDELIRRDPVFPHNQHFQQNHNREIAHQTKFLLGNTFDMEHYLHNRKNIDSYQDPSKCHFQGIQILA